MLKLVLSKPIEQITYTILIKDLSRRYYLTNKQLKLSNKLSYLRQILTVDIAILYKTLSQLTNSKLIRIIFNKKLEYTK